MDRLLKLHIDGVNKEGVFESGVTPRSIVSGIHRPPFIVFDEEGQENVAGPFLTYGEAVNALIVLLMIEEQTLKHG